MVQIPSFLYLSYLPMASQPVQLGQKSTFYSKAVMPPNRESPRTRVIISNINVGVTEVSRKISQIHVFYAGGMYSKGWAWVSFETIEEAEEVGKLGKAHDSKKEQIQDNKQEDEQRETEHDESDVKSTTTSVLE